MLLLHLGLLHRGLLILGGFHDRGGLYFNDDRHLCFLSFYSKKHKKNYNYIFFRFILIILIILIILKRVGDSETMEGTPVPLPTKRMMHPNRR